MDLSRVTIVLDKVRHPDNLGSAMRAMKNSGLTRLTLADPHTHDFERSRTLATDADDLLETMVVAKDLAAAVAHGTLVAGTTPRAVEGRRSLLLRDFVQEASQETARGGEVVVVFGNEQRGLSDVELDACQLVVSIPTSPLKSSINLAQAVMIVGYELFSASLSPVTVVDPGPPVANAGTLQALYARMRTVLLEADFLNRENPDDILSELKRLLERSRVTQREAELLLNAFKHLQRAISDKPIPRRG